MIDDSRGNSCTLWKIIGELAYLKKNKKTFPNQIVIDKEVIDDPQKICETFNIHFATVGENIGKSIKSHESTHSLLPNFPNSFVFSPATAEKIYSLIGNIKIKKAVRENDITNKLLKLSNAVISPFLCNIFISCIHQGEFPMKNCRSSCRSSSSFQKGGFKLVYKLLSNFNSFPTQQNF